MPSYTQLRQQIVEANKTEYGDRYGSLKWLSDEQACIATHRRDQILALLKPKVRFGCKDTKLDCSRLSMGCRICGQGTWSCLFINGKCNCRCFYCPSRQDEIDVPITNTVPFLRESDYVDYIEKFRFSGVSISGGEPLLTFDRTRGYISAVKRKFGAGVYVWMYTNGALATPERLCRLRDAGLDEIRFDIGATGYSLDNARSAVGIIPHVTVEIPAIPEDFEQMKLRIVEMKAAGIDYLNLHQLRLTPHNFSHLTARGYTFLHGEKVTVLESEITALNLLRHSVENSVGLPVNYCSFVYKNRFQKAAARKRSAELICKRHEDVTENGYIRSLFLSGDTSSLNRQVDRFRQSAGDQMLWSLSGNRLYFSSRLWSSVRFDHLRLMVTYYEAKILDRMTYRNYFIEVPLNRDKKVVVEKMRSGGEVEIAAEQIPVFERLLIRPEETPVNGRQADAWAEILGFETIPSGLQDYF